MNQKKVNIMKSTALWGDNMEIVQYVLKNSVNTWNAVLVVPQSYI
jgi:hypothetical protein